VAITESKCAANYASGQWRRVSEMNARSQLQRPSTRRIPPPM
jgi:hypothetical protein